MDGLDPALDLDIGEEALVAPDEPAGEERGIEDHDPIGLAGRPGGAQSSCAPPGRSLYNPAEEGVAPQ